MKMTLRPRRPLAPDDVHHPLGEVRRQCGGHLVEEEQRWLDGQSAREVDDPERRQWQVPDQLMQVEAGDAELRHPALEGLHRRLGERQVERTSRSGISDGPRRTRCRPSWISGEKARRARPLTVNEPASAGSRPSGS